MTFFEMIVIDHVMIHEKSAETFFPSQGFLSSNFQSQVSILWILVSGFLHSHAKSVRFPVSGFLLHSHAKFVR